MPSGGTQPIQVLHVDADMGFSSLASALIERKNEQMVVFSEQFGDAGLDRLENDEIDCVVSGSELADMDGLSFVRAVEERFPGVPHVLFAEPSEDDFIDAAIEAGASDCVRKEQGSDQYTVLAARIESAVQSQRIESELTEQEEVLGALDDDDLPLLLYHAAAEPTTPMKTATGGARQLVGYDTDQLESATVVWGRDVVHREDQRPRWSDIKMALEDDEQFDLTYRVRTADGDEQWLRECGRGEYDGDELVGVVGFVTSVTTPESWERKFARERNMLESLLNNLPEALYFKDTEGRHVRTSRVLHDLREELIGMTDQELYEPELSGDTVPDDMAVIETGTPVIDKEEPVPGSPEENLWTTTTKVPWYGIDGDIEGLIGFSKTFSPKGREQIDRKSRRLTDVETILDERIETELSTIEAELDDVDGAEAAIEAVDRLGGVVDDLKSLVQQEESEVEPEPIDIDEVAHAAWEFVETGDAALAIEFDDDASVTGDWVRVHHLLENLYREVCQGETAAREVTIRDAPDGFAVESNTELVADGDGDLSFEALLSEDGSNTALNIAQGIAEKHGWTIDVTRSERGGTRFEIG
jgi:DNA-binding NarL/FixJ family response regulator/PAS domain-containing protein